MAGLTAETIPTNPPAAAPNGVAGFFAFVGGLAGQVVQGAVTNRLNESNARSTARIQETLNANHDLNKATGANDPAAAQNAANRSFLEKFLPASMLYNTSTDSSGTVSRTPTVVYYAVIVAIAIGSVLIARKFLRRA